LEAVEQAGTHSPEVDFWQRLIYRSTWGNLADMSMWSAKDRPVQAGDSLSHLLVDKAAQIAAHLAALRGGRGDFIMDNTGVELAHDLLLADALLTTGAAGSVLLHVKAPPTFVSDVFAPDVHTMLQAMSESAAPGVRRMAARLGAAWRANYLQITSHPFWTSPLASWEMPPDLRATLAESSLLLIKGDANYRRWLGDRAWPFDLPLEQVLDDIPAPLALLRILKSEVAAGLPAGIAGQREVEDPRWMYSGRWGVIQFIDGRSTR
jgi:hypothetical protein